MNFYPGEERKGKTEGTTSFSPPSYDPQQSIYNQVPILLLGLQRHNPYFRKRVQPFSPLQGLDPGSLDCESSLLATAPRSWMRKQGINKSNHTTTNHTDKTSKTFIIKIS